MLLYLFRLAKDKIPRLSRAINASIEKLEKLSHQSTKESDLCARCGFVATTAPESPHSIDVEEEWARYLADGIITDEEELSNFDLCCFWEGVPSNLVINAVSHPFTDK